MNNILRPSIMVHTSTTAGICRMIFGCKSAMACCFVIYCLLGCKPAQAGQIGSSGAFDWMSLGSGMNNIVNALAMGSNGELYAGGLFTNSGGVLAYRIAKWDGASWTNLSSGVSVGIETLYLSTNGALYAGGSFTNAGGLAANRIAKWNGMSWTNLGSGLSSTVYSMIAGLDGALYAGGSFTNAGSVVANQVAKWDGSNWTNLGSGLKGTIYALAIGTNGVLYAGGAFTNAGGEGNANQIARWNGTSWTNLGSGLNSAIETLAIATNGDLYAGGTFTNAGGVGANKIAKWNGTSWTNLGPGLNNTVYALAISSNGVLYAGGTFSNMAGSGANRIAKWDGTSWTNLGSGMNSTIYALSFGRNGELYAGGAFTNAGGIVAYRIAKWDNGGVQPDNGSCTGGYQVVITGTALGNGSDVTNVTLCGVVVLSIDSQSATQIVVTAGIAPSAGIGDVQVYSTSCGVSMRYAAFTYTDYEHVLPAIPVSLPAAATNYNSFVAAWRAVAYATNYLLDVSSANAFTNFISGYQNRSIGNKTNDTVTGLCGGMWYYYRVRASNAGGISGNSSTQAVMTPFLPGSSWHHPTNAEPSGAFMRDPPGSNGVPPSSTVYIYSATTTNASSQAGGALYYRLAGSGSWAFSNLTWHSDNGAGTQYWVSSITNGTFGSTNRIQYYLRLDFSNADTTFLGTSNNLTSVKYQMESDAQTNPFSFTMAEVFIPQTQLTVAVNSLGQTQLYGLGISGLLEGYADNHGQIGIGRASDNVITQLVDRLGYRYGFVYDSNYNVAGFVDAQSGQTWAVYNSFRKPLVVTNALGYAWRYTYDDRGNMLSATDPLDRQTGYGYDSHGWLTSVTNARGYVTRYEYDAYGNMVREILPDAINSFGYDLLGRMVALTNGLVQATSFAYDPAGNLLTITDPLGHVARNDYDPNGNITNTVDFRGFGVTRVYDPANRLLTLQMPDGGRLSNTYDAVGQVLAVKDARGNVTRAAYLQGGLLSVQTNALQQVTRYYYDAQGRVTSIQMPWLSGTRELAFDYDALGNRVATTNPLNQVRRFAYDALGRLVRVTDEASNQTHIVYDGANQLLMVSNALGYVTGFDYDAVGNRTAITDALGRVTFLAYDSRNRLISITDPLGNVSSNAYNAAGRLVAQTDARGNTIQFDYDATGRLIRRTDPLTNAISFSYDANGNMVALTNARSSVWRWEYDSMNRIIAEVDANGNVKSNGYDLAGNLVWEKTANGAIITRSYDALNRVTNINYGSFTVQMNFHTNDGSLQSVSDAVGLNSYGYDKVGRITNVVDVYGNRVRYIYDARGLVVSMRYPSTNLVSYAYDALGRCTNITDWAGRVTRFEYDPLNRLVRTLLPNSAEELRSYDLAGRMTNITHRNASSNLLAITYGYDAAGNPTRIDPVGGLSPSLTSGVRHATYDADNRVLTFGSNTYYSDKNGNITNYIGPEGSTTLAYDERNLLTSIAAPDVQIVNTYNGLGHRVARVKNGVTNRFVLDIQGDMERVIVDAPSTNVLNRFYVHGPGGLLYSFSGSNDIRTYHGDLTGNVLLIADTNGVPVQRYCYDPYGRVLAQEGTLTNEYQYVGKYGVMAEGADLLFMRARWYSKYFKRFISKDPVYNDANAVYMYSQNSPVEFIDPQGLVSYDPDNLDIGNGYWLAPVLPAMQKSKSETMAGIASFFTVPINNIMGDTLRSLTKPKNESQIISSAQPMLPEPQTFLHGKIAQAFPNTKTVATQVIAGKSPLIVHPTALMRETVKYDNNINGDSHDSIDFNDIYTISRLAAPFVAKLNNAPFGTSATLLPGISRISQDSLMVKIWNQLGSMLNIFVNSYQDPSRALPVEGI